MLQTGGLHQQSLQSVSGRTRPSRKVRMPLRCARLVYHRFFFKQQPSTQMGCGLLIQEVPRSHITTYHSQQDSSGRVISSSQRLLPNSTQHSMPPSPGGGSNPTSQQASGHADPDLRPRGQLGSAQQTVQDIWT